MKKNILILFILLTLLTIKFTQSLSKSIDNNVDYIYGLSTVSSDNNVNSDAADANTSKNDEVRIPIMPIQGVGAVLGDWFWKETNKPEFPELESGDDCDNGINCDQCGDRTGKCRGVCREVQEYSGCEEECTITCSDGSSLHYLNTAECAACVDNACGTTTRVETDLSGICKDGEQVVKTESFKFCDNKNILRTLNIIHHVLNVARILVPIVLIILASIDLGKAVIASDDNAIKAATTTSLRRLIIGVIIFFVPTIVYSVMHLVDKNSNNDGSITKCDICFTGEDSNGKKAKCDL